jgi:hypothetical protein
MPKSAMAAMSRLVAIGRLMNPSEIFTHHPMGEVVSHVNPSAETDPQAVTGLAVLASGIFRVFMMAAM